MTTQTIVSGTTVPEGGTAAGMELLNELAYEGIDRRAVAILVDSVVLGIAFYAIGMIIGALTGGLADGGFALSGAGAFAYLLAVTAAGLGYFVVLEALSGQTLGKRLTGIRVVMADGSPVTMGASVTRNVLRIVDAIGIYLVGAISILLSGRKQRVGDRIARTVVVRAK